MPPEPAGWQPAPHGRLGTAGVPACEFGRRLAARRRGCRTLTLTDPAAILRAMEMTLDYAAGHFSQLLRLVAEGEEVVLRNGTVPVARIVPIPAAHGARPKVGEVTSAPVRWSAESFAALDDVGIKELGLL